VNRDPGASGIDCWVSVLGAVGPIMDKTMSVLIRCFVVGSVVGKKLFNNKFHYKSYT
jgi:hypothetical protein